MKQISFRIPDTQVSFMMELLQKKAVEAERAASKKNPDYLLDWDSVKNNLKVD